MWDFAFRKLAHIFEFFVLCWLLFRALSRTERLAKENKVKLLWLAALISIAYAASDEWHQGFVQGRHPALKDLGFDSLGVLIAAWLKYRKMLK